MALGQRRVLDPSGPPSRTPPWHQVPWFAGGVLVASVGIFLLELLPEWRELKPQLWLYGPQVVREGEWYRVLTTVVTHADLIHIGFNMMVLWTLGIAFERGIGTGRFALVSFITALGSAAFVLALAYGNPTVGASGMILGWAGAMIPIATEQGRKQLWAWLAQVAFISALPLFFPNFPISWQGHLGGFLFGLPCGLLLRNRARHFAVGAPVLLVVAALCVVLGARLGAGG
jgi:rhomboid protease GluP